ncbi:hypothetical protein CLD22_00010 [Rubrivivax gelatinosus]|nr:hypothetical protein [Rubrivivax gelatinosus]
MFNLSKAAVAAALLLAAAAASAQAPCAENARLSGPQINSQIGGKTMCATRGNDRWQEFHQSGGALIDFKKGPNDPVDPSKQVGTWSLGSSGADTVLTHSYGAGQNYSWAVCSTGSASYTLISTSGAGSQNVTVVDGQRACP